MSAVFTSLFLGFLFHTLHHQCFSIGNDFGSCHWGAEAPTDGHEAVLNLFNLEKMC